MSAAGSQAWLLRDREAEAAREVAEGNVACVWCGQPLELDDQCFAAELGAPVHVGCFEVLAQAGEVRDLAADRVSGSWQEDLFHVWWQAGSSEGAVDVPVPGNGRRPTVGSGRRTFPARRRSRCKRCFEWIEVGTLISRCVAVGGYVHRHCWRAPPPEGGGSATERNPLT